MNINLITPSWPVDKLTQTYCSFYYCGLSRYS